MNNYLPGHEPLAATPYCFSSESWSSCCLRRAEHSYLNAVDVTVTILYFEQPFLLISIVEVRANLLL